MDIIFDFTPKDSVKPNKVRIDSIQILTKEKRIIITATEGYLNNDVFVSVNKGKTFILMNSDYSDFIETIKLDKTALQDDIDKKYNSKEANPLENPLKG